MIIAFNRNIVDGPYGGGNIILAKLVKYFRARSGVEVCFDLNKKPDVVVVMDAREKVSAFTLKQMLSLKEKGVKFLHRINDNGSHRENDLKRNYYIIEVNKRLADETVFISNWLKNYFGKLGLESKNSIIINNAADRDIFNSSHNKRDKNDPLKIITHHWSRNMAKGFSIYEELSNYCFNNPDIAQFTFLGRCPDNMLLNAKKCGAKPYIELPLYLRENDLYITASVNESGGCHIVEGMACGLIPLVKKGGGGTEDYSNGYGFYFDDFDELKCQILNLRNNYDIFVEQQSKMANYTYGDNDMCEQYWNIIKKMVKNEMV